MDFHVNGRMLPPDRAQVRVEDAGLQHAVGLFETFCACHGTVFRLDGHLERLAASAAELGLAAAVDAGRLRGAVEQTIAHNAIDAARLRLTVTPGLVGLPDAAPRGEPTVIVTASEPTGYDPKYFTEGVTVTIAGPLVNPFDPTAGHKTLAYWNRLSSLRRAAELGAGETLWLYVSNHLASGAVSNLFLVRDGSLLTPFARGEELAGAIPAPVRPGIIRAAIMELAERHNIPVERRMLSVEDLLGADEVFLTNSSWLVLPVSSIEKKSLGGVGPITRRLRDELIGLIETETNG